jgi:hypothetical protein
MQTGGQFNHTIFDIDKIRELLFDKINKCAKCNVSESIDWLKCDGEDKVRFHFIIHNLI